MAVDFNRYGHARLYTLVTIRGLTLLIALLGA
jgi:hypothetical protein